MECRVINFSLKQIEKRYRKREYKYCLQIGKQVFYIMMFVIINQNASIENNKMKAKGHLIKEYYFDQLNKDSGAS